MKTLFSQKVQLTARLHAFMLVQQTKTAPNREHQTFGPMLYFLNILFNIGF